MVLQTSGRTQDTYVLIVEDDESLALVLEKSLELTQVKTRTASNGEEALNLIRQSPPAAIILDLMMPVMSGFSLLLELASDPAGRTIPVIVMSALSHYRSIMDKLPGNVVGVMPKGSSSLGELQALLVKANVLRETAA